MIIGFCTQLKNYVNNKNNHEIYLTFVTIFPSEQSSNKHSKIQREKLVFDVNNLNE